MEKTKKPIDLSMRGAFWTKDEEIYLREKWGILSLDVLSKKLKRTKDAIYTKASKMNLGSSLQATGDFTTGELCEMLSVVGTTVHRWIEKRGLRARKLKRGETRFVYCISEDDLIKWMEKNQDLYSTEKLPDLIFGVEPEWLKNKRKFDANNPKNATVDRSWSVKEEERLIAMVKSEMYTNQEIANRLNRTVNSIHSKIPRLIEQGRIPYNGRETKQINIFDITKDDIVRTTTGRWKRATIKKMVMLYEDGDYTLEHIADLFETTREVVHAILVRSRWNGTCRERSDKDNCKAVYILESDKERDHLGHWKKETKMKMVKIYESGGYTYEEIGDFFGCPMSTTKKIIAAAKKAGECKTFERKNYKVARCS